MNQYTTIYGETFDLNELSAEERKIYNTLKVFAEQAPEWWDIRELWIKKITKTGVLRNRQEQFAYQAPLAKLYQDLETRFCLKKQEQSSD